MKRVLFYVHYNKYDELSDYVIEQLKQIKSIYSEVIFISNSAIHDTAKSQLDRYIDSFIQRKNSGFDFAAWRDGLNEYGWDNVKDVDSLTLMNDTCFGPIYPLEDVYTKMEESSVDFWGLTNHKETDSSVYGIGYVPYHIQSYMQVFHKKSLHSVAFKDFWHNVVDHTDVSRVIHDYEFGLTEVLTRSGLTSGVFFDTVEYTKQYPDLPDYQDYTQFGVPHAIESRLPLIKVKAFTHNADNMLANNLLRMIKTKSDYNIRLIEDHFEDILDPSLSIGIGDKLISFSDTTTKRSKTIGVHIHTYYIDVFERYLEKISNWNFNYDLFLTVDSESKQKAAIEALKKYGIVARDIIVTGNKGRDVVPWLKVSKKLQDYDIAAHFHTKKSKTVNAYIGEQWQDQLFDQLVDTSAVNTILNNFETDEKLGVVIPDIPNVFSYLGGTVHSFEDRIKPYIKELWGRMEPKKQWSIDNQLTFVMPYGTMIWYRPVVLRKLTDITLSEDEIPQEPLNDDFGTFLHAIERLIVYVAWSEGYRFRISPNTNYVSRFFDNFAYNRTFNTLNAPVQIGGKAATKVLIKTLYRRMPARTQRIAKHIRNKLQ